MDDRRLEVKVGALVLVALAGVVALLWLMGELTPARTPRLAVDFSHTGNVVRGAPVKLGGVQVGSVERIELLPDRRDAKGAPLPVRMALSVDTEARAALRQDVRVTVATVGPLGEPYLELWPGSAGAPPLADPATLRGVDAPRLDLVAQQLSAFLDAASGVLERDPEAVQGLVGNVARLTGTLETMLRENRGEVRTLAVELSGAARDLRALAQVARTQLAPGGKGARLLDDAAASAAVLRRDLPALSRSASRSLEGMSNVAGEITPEDGVKLRTALLRYAEAGDHLERIAARADRLLARIEAGEGTLGQLQQDKGLYDEVRALVTDLRQHPWKILWKD